MVAATKIVLTGFMGSGKTAVGQLIAQALSFRFVDTDHLIEQEQGRSVAAIFASEGEPFFRQLETAVCQQLANETHIVIATGGRLMLDPVNANLLGANSYVVCLTASPEEIVRRVGGNSQRPLLNVADPVAKIHQLLAERAAAYGRYPQISTDHKTAKQVSQEIINQFLQADTSMSNTTHITVTHPSGKYDVVLGTNLLTKLPQLAQIQGPTAVITDDNVGPLYASACDWAACVLTIPAGEPHKTLETVNQLYKQLLAAGIDRSGTIVALGGGVVGDVAGFVAATYLRGIHFVQCPTSLLAMVDASVGGKVGVDLPEGKNLVGAFKQPTAVVADLLTLQTLPPVQFSAGMAEIIKHGLIQDAPLFAELAAEGRRIFSASPVRWQALVQKAVQVKRKIVQEDPYEHGRRALLNLGHTFAHAIEQCSQYEVGHGQAVAIGLVAAAHLSARLGHCAAGLQEQIEAVLTAVNLPTRIPAQLTAEQLYAAMGQDKKKQAGEIRFVLLADIGKPFLAEKLPVEQILATLEQLRG